MSQVTEFYRCLVCQRPIEINEFLGSGNVQCKCGGMRLSPTRLSRFETAIYLVTHPRVALETAVAIVGGKHGKN